MHVVMGSCHSHLDAKSVELNRLQQVEMDVKRSMRYIQQRLEASEKRFIGASRKLLIDLVEAKHPARILFHVYEQFMIHRAMTNDGYIKPETFQSLLQQLCDEQMASAALTVYSELLLPFPNWHRSVTQLNRLHGLIICDVSVCCTGLVWGCLCWNATLCRDSYPISSSLHGHTYRYTGSCGKKQYDFSVVHTIFFCGFVPVSFGDVLGPERCCLMTIRHLQM